MQGQGGKNEDRGIQPKGATFKMSDHMVGKVISEIKIIDITEAVEE
jgi:hypothetical protein